MTNIGNVITKKRPHGRGVEQSRHVRSLAALAAA
jgi:hypothetical protein